MSQRVALLGASDKPERFAHRALLRLLRHGHEVVPVHPTLGEVEGLAVRPDLGAVGGPVDTLTLYVGPGISEALVPDIVALRPGRVIFNPGTESAALREALDEAEIPWLEDCTLVMLESGRF